jgi:hypothetical protein
MTIRERQSAAKEKMKAAEVALQDYIGRSSFVGADPVLHRKLTEELRLATDEFRCQPGAVRRREHMLLARASGSLRVDNHSSKGVRSVRPPVKL